MMYSLINTAKLNGVGPEAYLTRVLSTIAGHLVNEMHELLPWNLEIGTKQVEDQYVFVERLQEEFK